LSRVGEAAAVQSGNWKVARTSIQECLRYGDACPASARRDKFQDTLRLGFGQQAGRTGWKNEPPRLELCASRYSFIRWREVCLESEWTCYS